MRIDHEILASWATEKNVFFAVSDVSFVPYMDMGWVHP
jgi:hypothetical protein